MYDHAQSARLGQKLPVENPGVLVVTSISLPEVAYHGQIVYLYDMDEFRVYDGINAEWMTPTAAASSGGSTKVSATEPVADYVGQRWLNTTDAKYYQWDGTDWVEITDPEAVVADYNASWALYQAQKAMALTQNEQTTYYSTTAPDASFDPPPVENDLWLNTDTNVLYKYLGSPLAWVEQDSLLAKAILDAGTAKSTVDGKISTYRTLWADRPLGLGPEDEGDLLYVIDQDNKVYRWPGAGEWVEMPVGPEAIADDAIIGSKLSGDAIDGKVITGATIQTAASGQRVVFRDPVYGIEFYPSGIEHAPGSIRSGAVSSSVGRLYLEAPIMNTGGRYTRIELSSANSGQTDYIDLWGDIIRAWGRVDANGGINIGAGRTFTDFHFGSGSYTTGPAGRITIPHGLNTIPNFAIFMNSNFHAYKASLYSTDQNNIAFQMHDVDTGTDAPGSKTITGNWLVIF